MVKRTLSTFLFNIALYGVLILTGYVVLRLTGRDTPSTTATCTVDVQRLNQRLDAEQAAHLKALELVTRGDIEGQILLGFYRDHAVFGAIAGPDRVWTKPDTPEERQRFLVVPSTKAERESSKFPDHGRFFYDQAHDTIFTPHAKDFTPIWLGVRLAHEVGHAYDFLTGVEPLTEDSADPTTRHAFALGEVRRHTLEIHLLDLQTHGRFAKEIGRIADAYPAPLDFPLHIFISGDDPVFRDVNALFPAPQSTDEIIVRLGSYNTAVNFLYCDRLGLGDEGKANYYLRYY